ncbi:MAG TPA: restriction endonuclease subunit S [Anaerolineae bacterium]|nr:restriction endonuclease subunit S [Anaerolineae bacterium]
MEPSEVRFNRPYLDFLLALADFSKAKRILLPTGVISLDDLPAEAQRKAVSIPLQQEVGSAMQGQGGFDLSIIIPVFGRVGGDVLGFPAPWNLLTASAQRHDEDAWLAWAIHSTVSGGLVLSLTSQGMLTSTLREPIRQRVIAEGLETVVSLGTTFYPASSVSASLLIVRPGHHPDEITLIDLTEVAEDADWISIAEAIRDSRLATVDVPGFWLTKVTRDSLSEKSRLDPYFYHPKFLRIEPPEGYTEVLLSDIAEIRGGRSLASMESVKESKGKPSIPFIQVGNITLEGQLSVEWAKSFHKAPEESSKAGFACPGDILITVAGTLGKVCLIPDSYADGLYYDTSVRRVRVNQDIVNPEVVYAFLNSEVARAQAERYASGSVIPTISSADLGNIRVFLPSWEMKELGEPDIGVEIAKYPPKPFPLVIYEMLSDRVISLLLSMEDEEYPDWRAETVEGLREVMYQVQKDHEPLDELVMREYPLPIALAYRRMIRAEHNPYEQVERLVELYEALTQFFYYVLLSDYLRNPALQRAFKPSDKGMRRAYESFSMDKRLKFIDGLLKAVKKQGVKDRDMHLFVPELLNVDICSSLDRLRRLRNVDAHSAAGTPAAQKALLKENQPLIEDLLNKVRFLRGYPLCRVQGSYAERGRIILIIEYFQGALYETDIREQEAPRAENEQPKQITADRDHVVLLNSQFDWLDLHPFYQVITSEEYRHEAHLCFHKQIASDEAGQRQIFGESIQFRREFSLSGIEELQRLVAAAKL